MRYVQYSDQWPGEIDPVDLTYDDAADEFGGIAANPASDPDHDGAGGERGERGEPGGRGGDGERGPRGGGGLTM